MILAYVNQRIRVQQVKLAHGAIRACEVLAGGLLVEEGFEMLRLDA